MRSGTLYKHLGVPAVYNVMKQGASCEALRLVLHYYQHQGVLKSETNSKYLPRELMEEDQIFCSGKPYVLGT